LLSCDDVRHYFPVTEKYVYLDHAAVGPLPRSVVEAVKTVTEEKLYGELYWDSWEKLGEKTRIAIATLLNAIPEEIALTPNTSEGLGIVGNGLSFESGDNIVTSKLEFTSNLFIWQALCKRYHLNLRIVSAKNEKLEIDDFSKVIDDNTRLVAISHVQFSNGFKIDLKELTELAHERGAYVITDAVQSVGQMPVDVRSLDVDFLACSGYKWLLSPIATGLLYIRKDLLTKVYPSLVGYRSAEDPSDFSFRKFKPAKSAHRFEHGQLNFPGFAGMLEAIRLLTKIGIHNIEKRISTLTDHIIQEVARLKHITVLSPIDTNFRSGIIKLSCREPKILMEKLQSKGIIVSIRAGGLRISPHFYNTLNEMDLLIQYLKKSR
jgi:selenocysteine lyase/cysteine desulfurase